MTVTGVDTLAYMLFGKKITNKGIEYVDLQQKLIQARMGTPYDVYIARTYLISILAALPLSAIIYLLFSEKIHEILGNAAPIIMPALLVFSGFLLYNLILTYPGFIASLRARKIDIALPHTVALMHALSRGNSDVVSFFEIISNNKKLYGEVSEEAKSLLLDIRMFNQDIQKALKNAGMRTPSETFRNLVESLSTVITTGGDLVSFFLSKSEQYRLKALDENKSFMELLGLLSETYVTGFAAGPLFIITLLVVLGLVGGEYFLILNIIIYVIIPGSALIFVILLSSLIKGHETELIETEEPKQQDEDEVLQMASIRFKISRFMQNPLMGLIEKPETVLYFSLPLALIFFIISTHKFYTLEFNQMIYKVDDFLIFAVLIAFIPYSVFVEIHSRRIQRVISSFPDFLNRLTSLHESGLTLAKSLSQLRSSDIGILNSEIRKMNADVEWNGSIVESFKNFGKRVKVIGVLRVATLLENASSMTGNIKDTLAIAASDALTNKMLEEERRTAMRLQIAIIYISFFIFLYVVHSLVIGFLPQIPELTAGAEAESIIGQGIMFSGIDKELYIRLFFHAAILVGFFSGLVIGQIGEGDVRRGLKHSILMVLIGYGVFSFIS